MRRSLSFIAVLVTALAPHASRALELDHAADLTYLCEHAAQTTAPATVFAAHVHEVLDEGSGDCVGHAVDRGDVLTTRIAAHDCARAQVERAFGNPVDAVEASREYAEVRGGLLLQTHEVVVGAASLRWLPYDDDLGVLVADVSAGIPLLGGAWVLDVTDQTVMPFEVGPGDAEELVALDALGALSMRVVFTLATANEPSLPFCVDGPDGAVHVAGRVLAAELIDARVERSRGWTETPAWRAGLVRLGEAPCGHSDVASPQARVISIDVEGALAASPIDVALLRAALESRLTDCYVEGIIDNARLQGVLTIEFEMNGDGEGSAPEVTIDMLDNDAMVACTSESVQSLRVPRPPSGEQSSVRATLAFRREP